MYDCRMDYSQEYIAHEYIELRMPPGPIVDGTPSFLIDPNHLHIWPRHSFMLIALPNKASPLPPMSLPPETRNVMCADPSLPALG